MPRPPAAPVAVIAVLAVSAFGIRVLSTDEPSPAVLVPGPRAEAVAAATRFLDGYVTAEGRTVRHDQGGDTVSEGQGYALLLSVASGDEGRFRRLWNWTRRELQRADGRFAWRWDGGVADAMPATDADIEIAWALVLAGERFADADLTEAGARVAGAVLAHSTVPQTGRTVLAAGPWAMGAEPVVNPSYHQPAAFTRLAAVTGDRRWERVNESGRALLESLVVDGRRLPPDWARVPGSGAPEPAGAPGGAAGAQYGLDAARVPLRLAASCEAADRALAAGLWPLLRGLDARGQHVAYRLDGAVAAKDRHPVGLLGAAAAAAAARDTRSARSLLDAAGRTAEAAPTYYGDAWVALGTVLLTTDLLTDCDDAGR